MKLALADLHIHNFRCLKNREFKLHENCNIYTGPNGSGKTSILESIYLLGNGHSFRTRETLPLISNKCENFTLFARTLDNHTIAIQKSISSPTKVKLDGELCNKSSKLAYFLPMQIFYQDIFQIIDAAPNMRRGLLDWGLFHVEHSYLEIWKNYRAILKQRNALLRQTTDYNYFKPWDLQLSEFGEKLHELRYNYFRELVGRFSLYLPKFTDFSCNIQYYKGWDKKELGTSLLTTLENYFPSDLQRQYTQFGPHQADIIFDIEHRKAKTILSRGQQKTILIALKLSQTSFLSNCIFLFDDVAAELDKNTLNKLINYFPELNGQVFVTSLDESIISSINKVMDCKSFNL